ncbi:hypothetical protein EN925_15075 [Mesorhizobium sp. M7A.F.Ca.US.006.04.2.1]|uniref:hypothetical protein n=1 Tax=unclassified Mesorhizobium TaxID=325217 RepID=UPI000FCAD5CA|nr:MULTISPECIES: hypothetical protein [unclassified Mesorhizobium]RUX73893.1 hypothetical protein EN990_19655 [Mesorhizobium sp. M7A.F.Ca.US.005.03.1.1]RUY18457.1 hypothetical protein EN991_04075 [Mesorhizobium sp. M7A.F.Ca.US.005.03.2.1]RVA90409.1 hypothetical protein EN925_15075 [Mesorhizobium sp. M7A.F.Ca.US.006.04.2.1]
MDASYPVRRKIKGRSGVTNGKELLPGIDGRSKWARRLHDLIANHVSDLGGPSNVTQSQYILVKSAANATIVLEQWEVQFAGDGTVSLPALLAYQSVANSLRRIFETLGLSRVDPPRDGMQTYDTSKLTPDEQQRLKLLNHKVGEVGVGGLSENDASEMKMLMEKCLGRGYGPSVTDPNPRDRPFHEIDYSRRI